MARPLNPKKTKDTPRATAGKERTKRKRPTPARAARKCKQQALRVGKILCLAHLKASAAEACYYNSYTSQGQERAMRISKEALALLKDVLENQAVDFLRCVLEMTMHRECITVEPKDFAMASQIQTRYASELSQ
jgi:histone H3/H4